MPSYLKPLQQVNRHEVPKSQWKKWPDAAQRVFNETYAFLHANQNLMLHPKTEQVPAEQWKTAAWNAAWIAADATVKALDDIAAGRGYARKK